MQRDEVSANPLLVVLVVMALLGALISPYSIEAGLEAKITSGLLFGVGFYGSLLIIVRTVHPSDLRNIHWVDQWLIGLLIVLGLITIGRDIGFGFKSTTDLLLIPTSAPTWLCPIFILGGTRRLQASFILTFRICYILGIAALPFALLLEPSPGILTEPIAWNLLFPYPFLLAISDRLPAFERVMARLAPVLIIAIALQSTRRYLLLEVFICVICLAFFFTQRLGLLRGVTKASTIVLALGFGYATFGAWLIDDIPLLSEGIFAFEEKGTVNSREGLITELQEQFSTFDYLFGRGVYGNFQASWYTVEEGFFYRPTTRAVIEIGNWHTVLKAGIIYLFVKLILMTTALVRYRKIPIYGAAAATVLIGHFLISFIFGLPMMSGQYMIVWLCTGILISPQSKLPTPFYSK